MVYIIIITKYGSVINLDIVSLEMEETFLIVLYLDNKIFVNPTKIYHYQEKTWQINGKSIPNTMP